MHEASWAQRALCIGLLSSLGACNAYKAELLSASPSAQTFVGPKLNTGGGGTLASGGSGGLGAGGTSGSTGGSDGSAGTAGNSSVITGSGGGEFPSGTRCGDGMVTGDEKCDISITTGMPGGCPTDCPMLGECTPRALNGAGCQAECVLVTVSCKGGDGCCPGACTHATDSDCSGACGDGTVETMMGETCEAGTSTPCPTMTDCDDKNACTVDMLMGSAANCNAMCAHTDVTAVMNGDGCCPTGANANTDNDCKPMCGNNVVEPGEDCDGAMGCDSNCKLMLTAAQQACLAKFNADDCDRCSCINCTSQFTACRAASTQTASDQCNAVLTCARQNNCTGTPCYCATDTAQCGYGTTAGPAGPCAREIEAAAGAAWGDVFTVNARAMDLNWPLGRGYAADTCRVMNCASVCR